MDVKEVSMPLEIDTTIDIKEVRNFMCYYNYRYVLRTHQGKRWPRWRGVRIEKMPEDLFLYSKVIWENKPDVIIETGTQFGGSALFFADMLEINGKGIVITIDRRDYNPPKHPRVKYLLGNSISPEIVEMVKQESVGKTVMLTMDSGHYNRIIQNELNAYANLVTIGQYVVVEDITSVLGDITGEGYQAVEHFLSENKSFQRIPLDDQYLGVVSTRGSWIKREVA
jgi:cephalosporin hydroxylase